LRKRLSTTIVLAVAATLALSACSGGGGGGGDKLDANKTPLTEYYEAIYGGYDEKEQIAKQKKAEELMAACMAKEGFEYTPVDNSQYMSFSEEDMEDRNTEKWVSANGYGMTLTPEQQEEQNEQMGEFVDPNQPYVQALSPGEQTAYYEVLYGPGPTEEEMAAMEEGDGGEYNWESMGCQGAAQHEVNGEDVTQSEKYKPLMDELNTVWEKLQKDPKVAKLDAAWSACMADAGYPGLKTQDAAMMSVNDASNAYYETATEAPDDAKLAELRENEIAVALADFKCAEKTDYRDKKLEVQFDVERQFIDDHKSELDAMIADVEQGK